MPESSYSALENGQSRISKGARNGIAAELAAGQRSIAKKALAQALGCHPDSLSRARRRLLERLPSSPELRGQLEEARERLRRPGRGGRRD